MTDPIRVDQSGFLPEIAGMNLFLTRKCNLRCSYCFVDKSHAMDLSSINAAKAIDFIVECGQKTSRIMHIGYIGGEPLTNWSLFKDITIRLRSSGTPFNIGFTTNGTLLNPARLEFIKENNLRVVLSFDGDVTAMNDRRLANGEPSYPKVRQALKLLEEGNIPFLVQLTITPHNASSFYNNIRHLLDLGVIRFIFGFALEMEWDNSSANALMDNLAQVFNFYAAIYQEGKDVTIKYIEDEILSYLFVRSGRLRSGPVCEMAREVFAIDVDGTIYPCQALVNYPEWRIGHIDTGFDIPRQALISSVRNDCIDPCSHCNLISFCRKCPRSNWLINGDPYKMESLSCLLGRTVFALVGEFVKARIIEGNQRFLAEYGDLIKKWILKSKLG